MEKITFIKTCGLTGKKALDVLSSQNPDAVYAFWDNDSRKWNSLVKGKAVYSLYGMLDMYKKGQIEKLIIPEKFYLPKEIMELKRAGFLETDIQIFCEEAYVKDGTPLVDFADFTFLPYLEFHVNDHCNLNCKGCSHFCPLVKEETFTDLKKFEQDIQRLKELVSYIKVIRILGGGTTAKQRIRAIYYGNEKGLSFF